jgi:hypothetical protein
MFSWPTGLTFDTKRNRLLVSTLGGEGFLYAFSPETHAWSTVRSLAEEDIHSITYSAAQDALFALTGPPEGPANWVSVVRYTPDGSPAGTFNLTPALPDDIDASKSQLVAAGDQLVLITQPFNDPLNPSGPATQRSYRIDTASGHLTALGDVRVVPEPAAAALWLGAAGAMAIRRRRR